MSRIGKKPVLIPQGVTVNITENIVEVTGKYGKLSMPVTNIVKLSVNDNMISVNPSSDEAHARAMWGTVRNNINNMIEGVTKKFIIRLEIIGVGYRASVMKDILSVSIGYSHEIKVQIPQNVEVICEKPTLIVVSGISKQHVGQFCAIIRKLRKYNPYKGKGIKFEGQEMLRKEGKKK